ncbi:glycoside hydrolase family 28 protein [Oidiodendron maius Zn]|uniref:Glycoside hydrolase family 28 protein n=1 Tax=Oidiodendron maius (strain Zn) TaxID=913774 RepID=A0A0C3GUJ5_OIDMZ|nr:glycoside hydrolase family 28 protein [Oidiodendron maius Zn]
MISFLILLSLFCSLASAQLSGSVGPLKSYKSKAQTKTCNVLDYGAKSGLDISTPLTNAWKECKNGGLVYIPPGTYSMSSWVSFNDGDSSAIQLDGTIYRTGTAGGTMININNCKDFEFFSGNSKGAMQGYGYEFIEKGTYGPRLIRFTDVTDFSFHGIALIDSPAYYLVFDTCSNGEIYNAIIRGITIGETDGIDVWGDNIWVHDVEVTNGDECVTVKSPAKNLLIEDIYCNISGGCAIGSLGLDTDISDISYQNLYLNQADACFIKTNKGSGTVKNISWDSVIVQSGSYPLTIDEAWGTSNGGKGVQISGLKYTNWHGTNVQNSRPVIRLDYNVNLWTVDGNYVIWSCENAYGTGACLRGGNKYAAYGVTETEKSAPNLSRNYASATMSGDLAKPYPSTKAFIIPPIPTTFFPGQKPVSKLLDLSGAGGLSAVVARATPTS